MHDFLFSKKKSKKLKKKLLKPINFVYKQYKNQCYHFDTNQNNTEMHDKKKYFTVLSRVFGPHVAQQLTTRPQ